MGQLEVLVWPHRLRLLADYMDGLIKAGFPAETEVTMEEFTCLLERVRDECVKRDETGVYVDLYRCKIRPPRG